MNINQVALSMAAQISLESFPHLQSVEDRL